MQIKTPRLLLRPYTPEDFEDYYAYIRDRELQKLLGLEKMEDRDCAFLNFQWLLEHRVFLALADPADGRAMGHICVHPPLGQVATRFSGKAGASLSFALDRGLWRRGLMTEALGAVIGWLFREGAVFLDCENEPANTASAALQKKLGFQYWGTERFEGTELTVNVLRRREWNRQFRAAACKPRRKVL